MLLPAYVLPPLQHRGTGSSLSQTSPAWIFSPCCCSSGNRLLLCGCCQQIHSSAGSLGATTSLRVNPAAAVSEASSAGWGGQHAPSWYSPWAVRESLLRLTFMFAELLSHFLTPLSLCSLPFLIYVIPHEVLLLWQIILFLASGSSILELDGTGSVQNEGSFWQLFTETTPIAPCYQTLAILT